MSATAIDRSPSWLGSGLALAAALVAMSATVLAPTGLLVGALGLLVLVAGLARASRGAVSLGAVALLAGVLSGGLNGAPALLVLVGVTGTVLAWDAARTAIGVGRQLGSEADTRRLELAHFGASAAVGGVSAVLGYAIYVSTTGGKPVAALFFLLLAAVLLAAALR